MSGTAFILLALSTGDLVAGGVSGEPESRLRVMLGVLVATIISSAGAVVACFNLTQGLLTVLVSTLGTAGWLIAKDLGRSDDAKRPYLYAGLTWLAIVLAASVALSGVWRDTSIASLDQWLASLPFPITGSIDGNRFLLLLGTVLFLSGPSNAVVRCVLIVAGTEWKQSQEKLRGGRFIGILERWMIFGLAVSGEPTAAALIVSAKSLLRFPELNRTARDESARASTATSVDIITEYFLLGSLLSWALVLAPLLLFAVP